MHAHIYTYMFFIIIIWSSYATGILQKVKFFLCGLLVLSKTWDEVDMVDILMCILSGSHYVIALSKAFFYVFALI